MSAAKRAPKRAPIAYRAAQQALAQCTEIDECQRWADKAKALASYAHQANDETLLCGPHQGTERPTERGAITSTDGWDCRSNKRLRVVGECAGISTFRGSRGAGSGNC